MFTIKSGKFDNLDTRQLVNEKTGESLAVIPEFGANLVQLFMSKNGKQYSVIKGFYNETELRKHEGHYSSLLFPFAGRLPDGKYSFDGKEYEFAINDFDFNTALHGFVYNKIFEVIDEKVDETSGAITLSYTTKNVHPAYPFDIRLSITYQLDARGFTCEITFANEGDTAAPMAFGMHPYFYTEKRVDDIEIKIPSSTETILNERLVPSGETKVNDKFVDFVKIGDRVFDNGFQFAKTDGIATTQLRDSVENLTMNIWQETGKNKFNFLQVYNPPYRDCIAIEPLAGNLNSLNNGDDLIILQPGETTSLRWGIFLS